MKRFLTGILLLAFPALLFADATTATRQRNFVNDKANSIPITASYMDSEFDNLITKVNSKVLAKSTAPSSPTTGDTWVDTSATPPIVKVYDGSAWAIHSCGKGADVASASAVTLGTDGCFFDITGTTTITSITARPAGSIIVLQFDGILTFTDGSNLKLAGNFTTAAESTITLISDGTNWWEIARSPTPSVSAATQAEMESASSTSVYVSPGRAQFHPGAAKAWASFNGSGTPAMIVSHNFDSSITDNGTGDWTLSMTTDFSAATYVPVGSILADPAVRKGHVQFQTKAAGTLRVLAIESASGTLADIADVNVVLYGDQS